MPRHKEHVMKHKELLPPNMEGAKVYRGYIDQTPTAEGDDAIYRHRLLAVPAEGAPMELVPDLEGDNPPEWRELRPGGWWDRADGWKHVCGPEVGEQDVTYPDLVEWGVA